MKESEAPFPRYVLFTYIYSAFLIGAGSLIFFKYQGLKLIELIRPSHVSSMTPMNPMIGFIEIDSVGVFLTMLGSLTLLLAFLSRQFRTARTFDFPLIAIFNMFSVLFFLNAYICDDAFITFRTVDNFVHGYGLRWNTIERVQTFTNPLWMFLVSAPYALSRLLPFDDIAKIYHISMILSYTVSLFTLLYLAVRFLWEKRGGALIVLLALLFSSRAFMEYTSSGLENPLSYLLIALFFARFLVDTNHLNPSHLLFYLFVVSLAFVNRMDSVLIYALPAAWLCFAGMKAHGTKTIRIFLLGFLPAYGWLAFSLLYFGFPFPNSYYAKLGMGSAGVTMKQGVNFLASILVTDPVTVIALLASPVVALFLCDRRMYLVAGSIVLSIGYIISTGGDFMGGRFASAPFLAGAILLAYGVPFGKGVPFSSGFSVIKKRKNERKDASVPYFVRNRVASVTILVCVVYNAVIPLSPFKTPLQAGYFQNHAGGARVFHLLDSLINIYQNVEYYYASNLLFYARGAFPFGNVKFHKVNDCRHCRTLAGGKETVFVEGGGIVGFCRGPRSQLIDPQVITDPLLARLPNPDASRGFIPGHVMKPVPAGLVESYATGRNCIQDGGLKPYYEKIHVITRGKLFTRERISDIFEMNFHGPRRYARPYF